MTKSYFRPNVDAMTGYTPGKQVRGRVITKLNTNENPYPVTPAVEEVLKSVDLNDLRLYPQPMGDDVRDTIADLFGFESRDNVILGNGSDDILTIAIRSFAGEGESIAFVDPTYSLYEVLAAIQGANCIKIPLNDDFSLPTDLAEQAKEAKLLLLPRPNAPTGTSFELEQIRQLCRDFDGVVLMDEAYADFADDNCIELTKEFSNVMVSRTLSKSYSLAGIRFGFALACEDLIYGMLKVKDSYNVNYLSQKVADAALKDQDYVQKTIEMVKEERARVAEELEELSFEVLPSQTNFLFVAPPDDNGQDYYQYLYDNDILVRYFPADRTKRFVRITIGTEEQMDALLDLTRKKY